MHVQVSVQGAVYRALDPLHTAVRYTAASILTVQPRHGMVTFGARGPLEEIDVNEKRGIA